MMNSKLGTKRSTATFLLLILCALASSACSGAEETLDESAIEEQKQPLKLWDLKQCPEQVSCKLDCYDQNADDPEERKACLGWCNQHYDCDGAWIGVIP